MEDISSLPEWNLEEALKLVKQNPLDQKTLKTNLDRIYMITGYNEQEYLADVVQTYSWLKLARTLPSLQPMLGTEKLEKYFLEDYIHTAIRYMILCRKFKMKQMMVLTQQIMVQALRIFVKYFDHLEKFPKMVTILKQTFDIEKQFYKLNYINDYPYLVIPPTEEEVSEIDDFIDKLKSGDRVDVLKTQMHSKRVCWLPGTVKKISSINVYVRCDREKLSSPYDRKYMQVRPAESKKEFYEWRFGLKPQDKIDFFSETNNWTHATIEEVREIEDKEESSITLYEIKILGEENWLSVTDPRIQRYQSIIKRPEPEFFNDDFNDVLFDPEMKSFCIPRVEATKSRLFLEFLTFTQRELHLFDLIANAIEEKKFKIQIIVDLIAFVYVVQPVFHHTFAIDYLKRITDSTLEYINNSKESTIRNFSKERYESVFTSINEFLKRLILNKERKQITEKLQLSLVLRFLFSDFLDRKLQAVTILTHLFKMSKHRITEKSLKEFIIWVQENKIIPAIYNEKSHSELISRSSDFMKFFLDTNPHSADLQPLLVWNQPILKLVSEAFDDFPEDFQEEMVKKIKAKKNVTNEDALNIIKKTINCEKWLLENGGESWVEVVKEKTKRKADIIEVFKQPFPVVFKITSQIHELHECRFRNEFFLYLNEIHFICEVLAMKELPLQKKIDFSVMALDCVSKVSDETFESILPYATNIDESLSANYQQFFLSLLGKLTIKQTKRLFEAKFEENRLVSLSNIDLKMFKKCFLLINQEFRHIDRKYKYEYPTPHSYKKEKRQILTINKNPNELIGMNSLLVIVFHNKNIDVTMNAIDFIGFLFNHLREDLKSSVTEFKKNFLENCLKELYRVTEEEIQGMTGEEKANLQKKYLKIIDQIMSQSEKLGTDVQPSVNALFPLQKIQIRLIDHFNVNKVRIFMEVPSNWTLYELRHEIGKHINAYVHEMKIMLNGKELDHRYNGHVLHTMEFTSDLIVEKRAQIPRIPLTEVDGTLVAKARIIFSTIFKDYSQFGLMSKKQCQKYHQKCVGEMSTMGEARVEKIYSEFDKDKDGYLTESDFLQFYEASARTKESAVWNNLETFGIRNDLEILQNMEMVYPEQQKLTRYLLYHNKKFMDILFSLLKSEYKALAETAWNLIARLPLCLDFKEEISFEKEYLVRYWLYVVEEKKEYQKITKEVLKKVLSMSVETVCIGLKLAQSCKEFDEEIFEVIIHNLKEINEKQNVEFHNKVILDNSLKILDLCLANDKSIKTHFIEKKEIYCDILREGIMSTNQITRSLYCVALEDIIHLSIENNFQIFQVLFNLVYKIFDKGDKSTLNIEYFDLFSSLLEILRVHPQLMPKLGLNWLILTKSIIQLYMTHECTESSINSKADQVAQGLLRIISRLLNKDTVNEIIQLVSFIFQKSLFPENGKNKLKNSKSRQDAYELIYEICKYKDETGVSPGLHQLFDAGFKQVYKKMSQKKAAESFSYYYYSYNEPRSELGYAGIRNLGCICYMISMIQQLYMTSPFRNLILMADDNEPECLVKKGNKEIDDNIFHQFKNMFANLLLTEKQEYNPDEFCFSFKDFEGMPVNVSIQQDAQEFLNIFFDKMQTSLKGTPFNKIFEDIFGGKSCSQIRCSGCNAVKERKETFYPLSLQIKGYKNIEESFRKFIAGEQISDYQCDSCNNKCDVVKRNFLDKTPNYFIIHLQRMCFNYDKFENEKVNSRWEFPHELNVHNYTIAKEKGIAEMNNEFSYTLKGIVVHYGTADFGHYFSYIKESDNLWIEFNDERVREFDPSDIEVECFGGEHWRRQSQSAYLLVYERQKKSNITLQFNNEEEKRETISKFKLGSSIIELEPKTEDNILSKELMEKEEKEEEGEKKAQESKIIEVLLDMKKIPLFVPENLKEKINKINDEFSFTINLSNDEFALFIYHVLSIDPPEDLKKEYLQLCYECFHLKQQLVDEEHNSINLSEWAAKRFKEIIGGHGWQFLKNFGKNWQNDILSIDRSTRTVIKSLLECVVSDIMKSNNLNEDSENVGEKDEEEIKNKKELVRDFLEKLFNMMMDEVAKHWPRFKEYFELWIELVKENKFVRDYCKEKVMAQTILEFILEDSFPEPHKHKHHTMGNQYYSPDFEHPLQLLHTLQLCGYELNDTEKGCFKAYAFMDKIIGHRIQGAKMIEALCRGHRILSEKLGYLLLYNASKVSQSDQIKPIISSIHEYLDIDDEIRQSRLRWILGFPRFIEHEKSNSYGSYGIHPESQPIIQYFSPLTALPILQQVIKFKAKAPHVSALLVSMLLQLEHDGFINNLDELPSVYALDMSYTSWFENFVLKYYNDTHKPYTSKNYVEYGNRIRMLWEERPNRPFKNKYPSLLLGKTIEFKKVSEETISEIITVVQSDIKSHLLPLSEETKLLTNKNIKMYKSSDNFVNKNLPKPISSYGQSSFMMHHQNSSDEEENEDEKIEESIFEKSVEGWALRKIILINESSDNFRVVIKFEGENSNLHIPQGLISCEIRAGSGQNFTFMKKDVEKEVGDLKVHVKILGKATKSGYWPRQLITEATQKVEDDKPSSDEDDSTEVWL